MREIKFRAWKEGQMYLSDNDDLYDLSRWLDAHSKRCSFHSDNKEDSILIQFTGLKDKNGKEIYDGDIVTVYHKRDEDNYEEGFYTTGKVVWSSGAFWINGGGYCILQHFHYNDADREIIGNIYENPELLKN